MKTDAIMLRVAKGCLEPADALAVARLKERGYKVGDVVACDIKKVRNPKFHRMAHVLGRLLVENVESFAALDAHKALKRCQWEAGIACDEMGVNVPNVGFVSVRIPQSLSFAQMDEGQFSETYKKFCDHVRLRYWPQLDEGAVEEMARLAGDAA